MEPWAETVNVNPLPLKIGSVRPCKGLHRGVLYGLEDKIEAASVMYGPLKGLYTGYLVVDGNGKENGSYCGIKCSGFGVKGLRSFDILSALRDLTKCRTHTECSNNTFPGRHAKQQGPRGQCPVRGVLGYEVHG